MNNIYGIPNEVVNHAPTERTEEICPYCLGQNTKLIDYEFTDIDDLTHEQHFCYDCEITFSVAYDWEWRRK